MPDFYDFVAPFAKPVITWMSRRNLPQTDGRIKLEGLHKPVEIIRDAWGIPHITVLCTNYQPGIWEDHLPIGNLYWHSARYLMEENPVAVQVDRYWAVIWFAGNEGQPSTACF